MKKKLILIAAMFAICMNMSAQKFIDGVEFMTAYEQAMTTLKTRFGEPVATQADNAIFNNVQFDGETFNEAKFFFDSKGRLNQLRLKSNCKDPTEAVKCMDKLGEKYAQSYPTTPSEDEEDGRFIVGYDKKGARLFTISTFKNICSLTFGPF